MSVHKLPSHLLLNMRTSQAMAAQAAAHKHERGAAAAPASQPSIPAATRAAPASTQQQQLQQQPAGEVAPASGPAAPGAMPQITPEMAKMAGDMMQKLPPEQLQVGTGGFGERGVRSDQSSGEFRWMKG